ncbi:MAG: helix-turn-helix domain-containing protein, partial [Phycisphaeraceae bacterium]
EVVRLGANETRHVDVRLISATNHDLQALVKEGKFREDLYFRIAGAELKLPPLRERRDDIPMLVRHYLRQFAEQMDREPPEVAEDVMMALMQSPWPGNVRQLMNAVQNMLVITEGDRIEPRHLPPEIRLGDREPAGLLPDPSTLNLEQIEKQAIRNALRINHGNRETAAKMLGIGERTLYRKLKEYGLK